MRVVCLVSLLLALVSCASAQSVYQGHVVFRTFFNSSVANTETPFEGTATLVQTINGSVSTTIVTLGIRGLQSNKTYGVHVHQWGDLSGSFDPNVFPLTMFHNVATVPTVGGHFDVQGRLAPAHNCAPHADRHTGDLGNITVAADTLASDLVTYTLSSELLDLGADAILGNSIIGRAIVIHENPDNCVQQNLGNWVAVGVIGIDNVVSLNLSNIASQDATIPRDPTNFAPKANAVIYNGADIAGNVWFWSGVGGEVHMSGIVSGFEPNSNHAVHIHSWGNVVNNNTIGAHFGDNTTTHNKPPAADRHWGDLGNLKANAAGLIIFNDITAGLELISLSNVSRHSIIGRSIAFHQYEDHGDPVSYGPRNHFGVIGLASATANPPALPASPNSVPAHAHAVLRPYFISTKANVADVPVVGTVDFQQSAEGGDVTVTIRVSGLQANKTFGIHIHTWGDLSGAIDPDTGRFRTVNGTIPTVGGHFDALGRPNTNSFHACAPASTRHTGDLGNITIGDVNATTTTTIVLTSELLDLGVRDNLLNDSIIGRAVVIHENPDICYIPAEGLGAWVAVGVIGLSNVAGNSAKQDTLPTNIKANVLVLDATTKAPIGDIQFSTDPNANGVIRAYGIVSGFAPNSVHGLHVHVWGNEDNAAASGPHYSQYLNDFGHGLPPSPTRHWGDLGNVTADNNGNIILNNVDINANLLSLWNTTAHGILGRTLTFHANTDDGGVALYGGRVAYGVIGLANPTTVLPAIPQPATPAPSTGTGSGTGTGTPGTGTPGTGTPGTGTPGTGTPGTGTPGTGTGTGTGTGPVTSSSSGGNTPSAATYNQVNVFIIAIAMMIASMFVVA